MKSLKQLTPTDLDQFTGSEQFYRHPSGLLYTEGVQFLAEKGGAYWLIDLVASYQRGPALRRMAERRGDFQLWELTVDGSAAVATCRPDSGMAPAVEQQIEFTDFPFSVALYCAGGVLMLRGEY